MTAELLKILLQETTGGPVLFGETTGELMRQLGRVHRPTECSCEVCRDMCKRAPCIGTPQDIMRIAQAGHIDALAPTDWGGFIEFGVPYVPMVQLRAIAGSKYSDCGGGQCPLWNPETGLCPIHAIKPVEGRFAGHSSQYVFTSSSWVAAVSWMLPKNRRLVQHLFSLVGVYPAGEVPASTTIELPGEARPAKLQGTEHA